MAIDKTGDYWKGSHLFDLHEYLEMAAVFQKVLQPICNCGSPLFHLSSDFERACVQSTCPNCGCEKQLRDSEEQWQDAKLTKVECPCGCDAFQIGVGIEMAESEIKGWKILGHRCDACGMLGYSANRCETVPYGAAGKIGSFVDVEYAPEILKAYPLQLYEVIYYGGAGDPGGADGRDAIYLVAAKNFADARDMVDRNLVHWDRQSEKPLADVVQEIGISLTRGGETRILRGPYFEFGYQFGTQVWSRNGEDDRSST